MAENYEAVTREREKERDKRKKERVRKIESETTER